MRNLKRFCWQLVLITILVPLYGCGSGGGSSGGSGGGAGGVGGLTPVTLSDDATLRSLDIAPGPLSPEFDPAVTSYSVQAGLFEPTLSVVPKSNNIAATITVNGVPTASGASTASIPLATGTNVLTIVVTAANGTANQTYTVIVTRAASASHRAYIKASNTGANNLFGWKTVLDGDTLAVAAFGEAGGATGVGGDQTQPLASFSGAVYVFVRSGATWIQQAYIKASNAEFIDYFGVSLDLDGDTLVVGARQEDSSAEGIGGDESDNSALQAGAAYVFVRNDGVWTQQAYLKASSTDAGDWFGDSVAVSGNTIVVGARSEGSAASGVDGDETDNSLRGAGAAYVFSTCGRDLDSAGVPEGLQSWRRRPLWGCCRH